MADLQSISYIEKLERNVAYLDESQQKFAKSLIKQKAHLSAKQLEWVEKLATKASDAKAGKPAAPKTIALGDYKGVLDLFKIAKKHLKHPKIKLEIDGQPVCLAVAGQSSIFPGAINVTDGKPYGQNKWFGRIRPDGTWEPGRDVKPDTATSLTVLLTVLASDPAGVAAEHGKVTGNCCFCNTPLTDPKSTAVGYGPVCADHFGLPWGAASKGFKAAA